MYHSKIVFKKNQLILKPSTKILFVSLRKHTFFSVSSLTLAKKNSVTHQLLLIGIYSYQNNTFRFRYTGTEEKEEISFRREMETVLIVGSPWRGEGDPGARQICGVWPG